MIAARTLLAGLVPITILAIGAPAAAASGTWTVAAGSAPVGQVVSTTLSTIGADPQVSFTDTTDGSVLTCSSASAHGTTTVGSGQDSAAIVRLNGAKATWQGCAGAFGLFTIAGDAGTWKLNAQTFDSVTRITTGTLAAVDIAIARTFGGCSFDLTGSVPVTYQNGTQRLAVLNSAASLIAEHVSGCFGAYNNGDRWSVSAVYAVVANQGAYNPVTITKP